MYSSPEIMTQAEIMETCKEKVVDIMPVDLPPG
jgi:hypothetical protein